MEAMTSWTEEKPWEIAWGSSIEKERVRDGSDDKVDGGETVGNSLGKAEWGRSETEATTRWTDRKPWEIAWERSEMGATTRWTEGKPWEMAWGELRWQGARWSNDKVNGNRGK